MSDDAMLGQGGLWDVALLGMGSVDDDCEVLMTKINNISVHCP